MSEIPACFDAKLDSKCMQLISVFHSLSARPSTFVHAPPGGKTTISLGGDYSEPAPARRPVQRNQETENQNNNYNQRQSRQFEKPAAPVEQQPAPTRYGRQAPGGRSSIVIG